MKKIFGAVLSAGLFLVVLSAPAPAEAGGDCGPGYIEEWDWYPETICDSYYPVCTNPRVVWIRMVYCEPIRI